MNISEVHANELHINIWINLIIRVIREILESLVNLERGVKKEKWASLVPLYVLIVVVVIRNSSSSSSVSPSQSFHFLYIHIVIGSGWAERRERRLDTRGQSGQYNCTHIYQLIH